MNRKERRATVVILALLLVFSILGVLYVKQMENPSNLAVLANRAEDFVDFGFSGGDNITVTPDGANLSVSWEETQAGSADIASQAMPLSDARTGRLQVDVYIGGKQNTFDAHTINYQVWLEAELLQNGAPVAYSRIPVPLESNKDRTRLYSLAVPYGNTQPDAYRIHFLVTPVDGLIAKGTLSCSNLIIKMP